MQYYILLDSTSAYSLIWNKKWDGYHLNYIKHSFAEVKANIY